MLLKTIFTQSIQHLEIIISFKTDRRLPVRNKNYQYYLSFFSVRKLGAKKLDNTITKKPKAWNKLRLRSGFLVPSFNLYNCIFIYIFFLFRAEWNLIVWKTLSVSQQHKGPICHRRLHQQSRVWRGRTVTQMPCFCRLALRPVFSLPFVSYTAGRKKKVSFLLTLILQTNFPLWIFRPLQKAFFIVPCPEKMSLNFES